MIIELLIYCGSPKKRALHDIVIVGTETVNEIDVKLLDLFGTISVGNMLYPVLKQVHINIMR